MLDLILPIARVWINLGVVGGVGLLIGFISGLFGVGGGFLMTPILIFLGVPSAVAVATGSAQLVASASFSTLVAVRQKLVDLKLSVFLIAGAMTGTGIGISLFNLLSRVGSLDLVVGVSYVVLLGSVGGLMLQESLAAFRKGEHHHGEIASETTIQRWFSTLPYRAEFPHLGLTISIIPLLGLSVLIGAIGTILGVGGGFMFVPALIYFFRLPIRSAVAASQAQILVTMVAATVLHAVFNHAIDVVLAAPLILGGVVGSHFGTLVARMIKGATFRLALALLILLVALRFLYGLIAAMFTQTGVTDSARVALSALPPWEYWVALQAGSNSLAYGLTTALAALMCGYLGARIFGRA
jgi:uncharacterized membrane protein YfcA